mgnify:CR=1 FL=1
MGKALCVLLAVVPLASFVPTYEIHASARLTQWEGHAPIEQSERIWDETAPECVPTNGWHVCS